MIFTRVGGVLALWRFWGEGYDTDATGCYTPVQVVTGRVREEFRGATGCYTPVQVVTDRLKDEDDIDQHSGKSLENAKDVLFEQVRIALH